MKRFLAMMKDFRFDLKKDIYGVNLEGGKMEWSIKKLCVAWLLGVK